MTSPPHGEEADHQLIDLIIAHGGDSCQQRMKKE